jgi:Zn-dependent peptidase ImmA (M78 family)
VLLIGDLGSHHSALDTDTFRGFAIADPVAPFVVINDKDARVAWSFTLLHELVHIWLGQTGVSGGSQDQSIERFCNDVASEYLLPSEELRQHSWHDLHVPDAASAMISDFAKERNVSRQMVAYRLFRAGHIDAGMWQNLRSTFHQEWLQERLHKRQEEEQSEGGPSYYVVRRHRIGNALIDLTARMLASGALTTTKAGKILGVRPANVATLIGTSQYWSRAS